MLIEAFKGQRVFTFDVPGVYLQTDLPEGKFALLNLEGIFVDIICEVNPEYSEYVLIENGVKVL